jgi:hypothetical protein
VPTPTTSLLMPRPEPGDRGVIRVQPANTPHQFENLKLIEMGGALTTIVAGVLAILVVGAITDAQRARRAEWDAA